MTFYSKVSAMVVRNLTKYGLSVTLRPLSEGGGDYDPDTGLASPSGTAGTYDETRKALLADQPGSQISIHFGRTLQNGTLIQDSDKWVYMDADGAVPKLHDNVIIQSIEYKIVNVQVTNPGGVAVLYLLVLRA